MKGQIKFNHILYLAGFLVLTLILFNLGDDDKQIPQTTAVQENNISSCVDESKLPSAKVSVRVCIRYLTVGSYMSPNWNFFLLVRA